MLVLGLIAIVVLVLASPVVYWVGWILMAVAGAVAIGVSLFRSRFSRRWGTATGAALVLTLATGIVSNVTYNTSHLWGIGYELSDEEAAYVAEAEAAQNKLDSIIYENAVVVERYLEDSYPSVSYDHSFDAANIGHRADAAVQEAEQVSVPSGCEEHHELWLEATENVSFLNTESGALMLSGDENLIDEHLDYAKAARRDAGYDLEQAQPPAPQSPTDVSEMSEEELIRIISEAAKELDSRKEE